MQQRQPERLFPDNPQPVTYRFAHNRPVDQTPVQDESPENSAQERRHSKEYEVRKHKRRRIFTWWNLFAVIGIITVIIQTIRYVIVPLLVSLNSLTGGVL